MPRSHRSTELGAFLRKRRAERSPTDVGLPGSGTGESRRVPGLRRQEVAELASISTDYCTRIEQGRMPASLPVLGNLARTLRLSRDEWSYMLKLAVEQPCDDAWARNEPSSVDATVQRILDDLGRTPAFVIGPHTEVLAWNRLAARIFLDFGQIPLEQRLFVRLLFTDPRLRSLYDDWEEVAHLAIDQLRMHTAHDPDNPGLLALVAELSALSPQFDAWWDQRQVNIRTTGTKLLHHPTAGDLELEWSTLTCAASPDQQMVVWTGEPGSATYRALQSLAWCAAGTAHQDSPGLESNSLIPARSGSSRSGDH